MTAGKFLVLLLLMGIFVAMIYFSQTDKKIIIQKSIENNAEIDDATYLIDGRLIDLQDGSAEFILDDLDNKIVTRVFSHKIIDDINNDNYKDAIVILTQDYESVENYYVALALGYQNGYHGSNAILLGEAISPQIEEYRAGIIIVNYTQSSAEQKSSSQTVSKYLSWEENALKEIFFANDLINLSYPAAASYVSSPLTVVGEARGYWYFEGDFPVIVTNWDGLIIAEGIATAQSEWMTEDFVPFEAVLEFDKPSGSDKGYLILQKDNPSGESDKDDALEIPIFFE